MEKTTNLQKIVKAMEAFCKECSKNRVTCNPEEGEYCNDLVDYIKNISDKSELIMNRILIRKLVRNIFREAVYLDTMMEFEDQKNPDSVIALNVKEEDEIYSLFDEVSKL